MKRSFSFFPDTIRSQMIAIIIGALVVVSFAGGAAETLMTRTLGEIIPTSVYAQQASMVTFIVDQLDDAGRAKTLAALNQVGMPTEILRVGEIELRMTRPDIWTRNALFWTRSIHREESLPGPTEKLVNIDGSPALIFPLDAAQSLVFPLIPYNLLPIQLLYYVLAICVLAGGFSIFAVWGVSRPIRRLAATFDNTENFLSSAEPLPTNGAREFRRLSAALEDLRGRLRALLEGRMRSLRSVSHDLRTPLTRLRLRLEQIEDETLRAQALSDITRLDAMIEATLRYLREGTSEMVWEPCELSSLLHTICDDFADTGAEITCKDSPQMIVDCAISELARAITNLCENGLKFGPTVTLSLNSHKGNAIIDIADDGPGIPEGMRSKVLEPYVKLDAARGSEKGFGLGLSITAEIVAKHHGKLELLNNHPKGLLARITLPKKRSEVRVSGSL